MKPGWIEFPRVSGSLLRRHGVRRAWLAPLRGGVLELDFCEEERPLLVTRIIEAGSRKADGTPLPERFVWEMPISARVCALLRLAAMEDDTPAQIVFDCDACSTQLALELDLSHIAANYDEPASLVRIRLDAGMVHLRLPTGADQREMSRGGTELDLLSRLAEGSQVMPGAGDLDMLDDALARHDPLVDYHCDTTCCECGARATHAVDLQGMALRALRRLQRDMLEDVHALAASYHWTEQTTLGVPKWRRAWYLQRLSQERR